MYMYIIILFEVIHRVMCVYIYIGYCVIYIHIQI